MNYLVITPLTCKEFVHFKSVIDYITEKGLKIICIDTEIQGITTILTKFI